MKNIEHMSNEQMNKAIAAGQLKILTYIVGLGMSCYQVQENGHKKIVADFDASRNGGVKYTSVSVSKNSFKSSLS